MSTEIWYLRHMVSNVLLDYGYRMNVNRSGDLNQRNSILKPLSTGRKRPEQRSSSEPLPPRMVIREPQVERKPSYTTRNEAGPVGQSPPTDERPAGGLINHRVSMPVWLVAILVIALVAGPTLAVLYEWNSGGNQGSQALTAADPLATAVEAEPIEDEEIPLALEIGSIFDGPQRDDRDEPDVSSREQYLLDQGVNPDLEVRYAADEVEQLQAELEAIQRNSAMLRSLARQQSGDLSAAYSSLEVSQDHTDGAVEDLQARIDDLEERIQSVDDIARELRDLLGLESSDSGMGGPAPVSDDADPWHVLRADIVAMEQWAGGLVFDLDEVNTEIQLRLAKIEQARIEQERAEQEQVEQERIAQEEAEAQAQAQAESQTQAPSQAPQPASVSSGLEYYDSTPMGWPVQGPITSRFGIRGSPFAGEGGASEMHTGIDISARTGTPVIATGGGTVQVAGNNGGYGLLVVIDHGRGITSWYGHNSRLLVSPGQRVNAGDVIAEVGSTGRSTGPHVHYEVRINGAAQDPMPYMQMKR